MRAVLRIRTVSGAVAVAVAWAPGAALAVVARPAVAAEGDRNVEQPNTGQPNTGQPSTGQLYVAPWGRDSWPGTFERPFATPERARQAVRARTARMTSDLVVNLRTGTYALRAPLRLSEAAGDSGGNGHRVIYQAYGYGTAGQERVTLSGGHRVTGWRPDKHLKGFWRADVGALETRQFYVADRRAARLARDGRDLAGTLKVTRTGYTTTSTAPLSWRDPGDIELVFRYGYAEGRCGVAGVSRSARARRTTITMAQPCWRMARTLYQDEALRAGPTVIENSTGFPHRPGSWYLDRSRPGHHVLRYLPRPGEDMRRVRVVVPVLQTLLGGSGSPGRPLHDLAFRGLTFAHAGWLAPSERAGFAAAWSMYMRPAKGGDITALTVPGNIVFHTAERITFEGDRFTHLGAQGLELSADSSHNVVTGSVFTDISDGGILMGIVPPEVKGDDRGNRISDSWIHHIGVEYHAASGIWDTATRETTIEHNQIDHVPYSGILSGPSDDLRGVMRRNRIVGNRVFRTNRLLADGGGIYLRGEQGTSFADGAVISENVVTDSRYGDWNVGIYTDDSTNRVTVDRNVVHDYVASIGGCSEEWGGRPVRNVSYNGNFWDDAVPGWVKRRAFPGAWPTARQACGDPHGLRFTGNTLLRPAAPGPACAGLPACAAIVTAAGPRWR